MKVALAVQGSFGHIVYAAGVLDAFRHYNHGAPPEKQIRVELGSACVEMLTPLWKYLKAQDGAESLRNEVVDLDLETPPWAQVRIAPPTVRADAVGAYISGLAQAQRRVTGAWLDFLSLRMRAPQPAQSAVIGCHKCPPTTPDEHHFTASPTSRLAELSAAWQDLSDFAFGLPGTIAFNPLFIEHKREALGKVFGPPPCGAEPVTVFTNATNADDLSEIYLYSGTAPDAGARARMTSKGKRQVHRLTPEYFFASGARPPYILPVPVTVDGQSREEPESQRWMEGAMRCNPPLNPLIDMGATHIVLLRFFCKDVAEEPNNNLELNDRFNEAIFNIPLQKEIEFIEFNNTIAECAARLMPDEMQKAGLPDRRVVRIIDLGDRCRAGFCQPYVDFLERDLGYWSHWDGMFDPTRRRQMFQRGFEIGEGLVSHLKTELGLEDRAS